MSLTADVTPLHEAAPSRRTDPGAGSAPKSTGVPVSMVERMTLILDAFEGPGDRLILEEVARVTHLPRSTAYRILDQLVQLGWLRHGSYGYSLGPRALALGGAEQVNSDLRFVAAPLLHDLVLRTGLVGHLGVLENGSVRYLDKIGGRQAIDVPSRVGTVLPAYATALGKAMLAWLEPEDVEARIGEALVQRTDHTVRDMAGLHLELHRIRGRGGLAIEREECFPGIGCIAVAIRGPEGPFGALSLVGEPGTPLERVAPLLVNAARNVSIEMCAGLRPC